MNIDKAIEILEHHNRWRRDENIPNSLEMVNPTELGKAIDLAIVELRMRKVSQELKEKREKDFDIYVKKHFTKQGEDYIDKAGQAKWSLKEIRQEWIAFF